jgi:hypothetical protein
VEGKKGGKKGGGGEGASPMLPSERELGFRVWGLGFRVQGLGVTDASIGAGAAPDDLTSDSSDI